MKIVYLTLIATALLTSCGGGEDKADNTEGEKKGTEKKEEVAQETEKVEEETPVMVGEYTYYGIEEINTEDVTTLADMHGSVDSTGSFSGKITGNLAAVCKKAGCWVTLENGENDPLRVYFGNHDFFVPTDTEIGKEVILQGTTRLDTITVDFQKHLLDDEVEAGGEVPQEMYDAITEDKIETTFIANAILIK